MKKYKGMCWLKNYDEPCRYNFECFTADYVDPALCPLGRKVLHEFMKGKDNEDIK